MASYHARNGHGPTLSQDLSLENNIRVEQYIRREKLRFNNVTETEGEDFKTLVTDIIHSELGVHVSLIRFHAIHRVGKKVEGKCGPKISRFISCEEGDLVWSKKGRMKHCSNHNDAYITEDCGRAIQIERKVLIKAMVKAREVEGIENVFVKGRQLIINNERCASMILVS